MNEREILAFALFYEDWITDYEEDETPPMENIEYIQDIYIRWEAHRNSLEHHGDCTKEPQPCLKCIAENYYSRADMIISALTI